MTDVICALAGAEAFEDGLECIADGIERAGSHAPQERLELGKDLLDRVEVGAVGREIEQPHPGIFEALADACDLVSGKIVDHHDAAGLHLWDQPFFEPLLEDFSGHRARDQHRGEDAVMLEACHEGLCHPVPMRGLTQQFLALPAPAMRPHHAGCRAGFIDEHKAREVETGLGCRPELTRQGNVRPVLLARKYRFF